MKFSLLALASTVSAHYTFSGLKVNGQQVGRDWQYIRQHTRNYMPTKGQQILSNDFRCQPGASSGANTGVYNVKGGDEVMFTGAFGMNSIEHPGPAEVYFSKAPGSVKSYDGSGDWFKVRQSLLCSNPAGQAITRAAWCTWGQPGISFTVPKNIPEGEYLVRVEHIPLHGAHEGNAEYYYSCGQLNVQGTSGSIPKEVGKIPGMIQPNSAAVRYNIYSGGRTPYSNAPGVKLMSGGTQWGDATGSTKAVKTV